MAQSILSGCWKINESYLVVLRGSFLQWFSEKPMPLKQNLCDILLIIYKIKQVF